MAGQGRGADPSAARLGARDHHNLSDPNAAPNGYRVLPWFQTGTFEAAVARGRALAADIIREPFANPDARHLECWMRDPDGYVVALASREGDVG
jgi:hypothetical protein